MAAATPDSTAERVALWRAMHVQVDSPPHVLEDVVGLALAAPSGDWRSRPDMDPEGTRGFRAAIVARARFIEDLVTSQAAGAYRNTCCWARDSTPSPNAEQTWPGGCACSRSTNPQPRRGSANG